MNTLDPLQHLRDIHLPPPVSCWPLAPGWFALITLIIMLIGIATWLYYRQRRRFQWQRIALKELQSLEIAWQQQTSIIELATLLKRVALARFKREDVAGLTGEAWLQFLDRTGKTKAFTEGVGRLLLTAPYQAKTPTETIELLQLVKRWIKP